MKLPMELRPAYTSTMVHRNSPPQFKALNAWRFKLVAEVKRFVEARLAGQGTEQVVQKYEVEQL